MKVKNLIEALQKCNPEFDVYFKTSVPKDPNVDGVIKPVDEVEEQILMNIKTNVISEVRVVLGHNEEE